MARGCGILIWLRTRGTSTQVKMFALFSETSQKNLDEKITSRELSPKEYFFSGDSQKKKKHFILERKMTSPEIPPIEFNFLKQKICLP